MASDPLERLAVVINFEALRPQLELLAKYGEIEEKSRVQCTRIALLAATSWCKDGKTS